MEEIKVTIKADGSISYEVRGVKGKSCKELTKAIDELGQVESSKKTSEYNEVGTSETISNKNTLGL